MNEKETSSGSSYLMLQTCEGHVHRTRDTQQVRHFDFCVTR